MTTQKARLQQLIPGLSIWAIDEARKHATKAGFGTPITRIEPIVRTRLDPAKVDHFVDFISRPNFLQDVAYGTKILKLSNGERIEIPKVVKTVIASRLVDLYQSYCQENDFSPLGKSTLFNILKVCLNIKCEKEREGGGGGGATIVGEEKCREPRGTNVPSYKELINFAEYNFYIFMCVYVHSFF